MIYVNPQTFASLERATRGAQSLAAAVRDRGRLVGLLNGAAQVAAEARRRCPRSQEADGENARVHLADTIGYRLYAHDADHTTVGVGTDLPRGPMVEYGTRPHPIVPRNKGALYWPGAAHPSAAVFHPGTKAQPYLHPAMEAMKGAVRDAVALGIAQEAARATGRGG